MPEGDTVWRAARHLDQALRGATIVDSDLRVPRLALVDLSGATINEVVSRGKHLLVRTSHGLTLHSHLRMDGAWHLYREGSRWTGGPDHTIRAILRTPEWSAIGYRVHDLAVVATADEDSVVGHLGPDLLGPDWDHDRAATSVRSDTRTIAEALLDQRNLAGIGNLYKSEVLFLHGVWPWTPAAEVDGVYGAHGGDGVRVVDSIITTARRLLVANRDHVEQSTTGDLRAGRTHWVYGRAGRPCRRCATRIGRRDQGVAPQQRVTFFCPHCQPTQAR